MGRGVKYYSKLGVAEFSIDAAEIHQGDNLCVTGPTTGILFFTADDIRYELKTVETAHQGEHVSLKVPAKVRPSDKLFKIVPSGRGKNA